MYWEQDSTITITSRYYTFFWYFINLTSSSFLLFYTLWRHPITINYKIKIQNHGAPWFLCFSSCLFWACLAVQHAPSICFYFFVPARTRRTHFFFFTSISTYTTLTKTLKQTKTHEDTRICHIYEATHRWPWRCWLSLQREWCGPSWPYLRVVGDQVRGLAVRTARRLPLEQVLAILAGHVFLEDGRLKLVKHLPHTQTLGTLARGLWDYGDCDRCAVARVERRGSVDTIKPRQNTPVRSRCRCGCSTIATYGGTTSVGKNHPTTSTAGAITNNFDFAHHDCLPSVARVFMFCVCVQRAGVLFRSNK